MRKEINEICVEYAQKYGGGLPLSAKEICNAVVLWVQEYAEENLTPEEVAKKITGGENISVTVQGEQVVISNTYKPTALDILNKLHVSHGISADLTQDEQHIELHLDGEQYKEKVTINVPSSATSGVLPDVDYLKLIQPSNAYISFNNEEYYLSDDKSRAGYMVFTHVGGDTNSNFYVKSITVTHETKGWVLTQKEIGAGGGGGGGLYLHRIADSDEGYHFVISGSNTPYKGLVPQAIKNDLKAIKYASGYSFSQLDELEFGPIITTSEGAKYIMYAGGVNVSCYSCGNEIFSIVNDTVTEI